MAISKSFLTVKAPAVSGGSTPISSDTTVAFSTVGIKHLLVGFKHENGASTITPSSTAVSGSWTPATKEQVSAAGGGDLEGQFWYADVTTNATGQTVSGGFSPDVTFSTIGVWGITTDSGVLELVSAVNDEGNSGTPNGGTLSNAGGDSVVSFMMMLEYSNVTHTAAGWTGATNGAEDFDPPPSSDNFTAGYSRGAETTTSIAASGTQNQSVPWGVIAIMFKEGTAGGSTIVNRESFRRGIARGVLRGV